MRRLAGKTVVVTGGSGGLGEQICYEAARAGATLVVCARRVDKIETVRQQCEKLSGTKAYAFTLDLANNDSIMMCAQAIQQELGQVDVLVNNAGYGMFAPFMTFESDEIAQMFSTNVLGLMTFTQALILMMTHDQSHIMNVASMAGKMATPKAVVYAATKFAIVGFSDALRLELKTQGILVTTINPGPMATDFFAEMDPNGAYLANVGRWVVQPEQLAQRVVRAMLRNKREINAPRVMAFGAKMYQLFPKIGDFLTVTFFNKK